MSFPEEWNMKPVAWFPGSVQDLEGWVRRLASTSSYMEGCWHDLTKGRWKAKNHGPRKAIEMQPPPSGEEEISNPPKEKKEGVEEEEEDDDCLLVAWERGSPSTLKTDDPKETEAVQYRKEDISEGSSSKVPEPSGIKGAPRPGGRLASELKKPNFEAVQRQDNSPSNSLGAVLLHRRAFSKSRTELSRYESELNKVLKKRDSLKILYVKKEGEISDLRVELTKACRERAECIDEFRQKGELVLQLREELKMKEAKTLGWRQGMDNLVSEKETLREQLASLERQLQSVKEESLARGRKIEGLKARSAAELDKFDIEAIVSSYRVNAEAANSRAKEISATAEVKLSSALDNVKL
ncbi:MAR-binding filament-like protein 1 [Nicotiana sylvestris]|uniref:MAR-binding filament-like protein 1 n=1 Tax=Nicotiana sylvestris TaxID=4096 RepID=UPI00388C872E